MATVTKAAKVTDTDLSGEVVNEVPANAEATEFKLDNEEVRRVMTRIRYRLAESVRDANRRTPILSESKEVAIAKARSLMTVLKEFSEQTL